MTSKLKTDVLETGSGSGTIALNNQLSGMTHESMPSGSVVQVVNNTSTAYTSTTSSTLIDIGGATVTITPTSTSSRVIITASISGMVHNSSGAQNVALAVTRNGVNIHHRSRHVYTDLGGGWQGMSLDITHVDTPSTTSAVTYNIQFSCSTSTIRANDYAGSASNDTGLSITATEIKG